MSPTVATHEPCCDASATRASASDIELTNLIYGVENPLLRQDVLPGHGVVTREVFDHPIYRMMVETLLVDPRKCVYLDDLGVNLKPARDMGMTTIKVTSAAQAIVDLEAATGLVLR